jgi:hypothetical protein
MFFNSLYFDLDDPLQGGSRSLHCRPCGGSLRGTTMRWP